MTLSIIDLEWTSWKGSLDRDWSLEFEKKRLLNLGQYLLRTLTQKKF